MTKQSYPYCEIKAGSITLNGQTIFEAPELPFGKFIKQAYKQFELAYPKFHKMDRLCKLAFVAASSLLNTVFPTDYKAEEIAVVMANKTATLQTDTKHALSITDRANYYPSPAVFVYTLPNIMVGEICIRYDIKGESLFLVAEKFDKDWLLDYSQDLIQTNKAKACLMGWVDYTDEDYHAILYWIDPNNREL